MFAIPGATHYADWSLLLPRLMMALVFGTSGSSHLKSPGRRAKSIGMSVGFTVSRHGGTGWRAWPDLAGRTRAHRE
jgi:hypothetical protein